MDIDAQRFELTTGLATAGRQWLRLVEHALGDSGIPTGCITPLIFVGRAHPGINQVTLADQLGLTGPSLVRTLDWLCDSNLVKRAEDSVDRRAKLLSLTASGQALAAKFETRLTRMRTDVLGGLSMADITAALRVHSLIARAAGNIVYTPPPQRRARDNRFRKVSMV